MTIRSTRSVCWREHRAIGIHFKHVRWYANVAPFRHLTVLRFYCSSSSTTKQCSGEKRRTVAAQQLLRVVPSHLLFFSSCSWCAQIHVETQLHDTVLHTAAARFYQTRAASSLESAPLSPSIRTRHWAADAREEGAMGSVHCYCNVVRIPRQRCSHKLPNLVQPRCHSAVMTGWQQSLSIRLLATVASVPLSPRPSGSPSFPVSTHRVSVLQSLLIRAPCTAAPIGER